MDKNILKQLFVVVFSLIFLVALIGVFASTLATQTTPAYHNDTFATLTQNAIYALTGIRVDTASVIVTNTTSGLPYEVDTDYNLTSGDLTHAGTMQWLHKNMNVPVSVNYTYEQTDYVSPTSPFALMMGLIVLVLTCTTIVIVLKKFGIW